MSDAERIRELLQWGPIDTATNTRQVRLDNEREALQRVDALAAENAKLKAWAKDRDAMIAYARALEIAYMQVRGVPEGRVALGYIQEGHTTAVAAIMAQEDE